MSIVHPLICILAAKQIFCAELIKALLISMWIKM